LNEELFLFCELIKMSNSNLSAYVDPSLPRSINGLTVVRDVTNNPNMNPLGFNHATYYYDENDELQIDWWNDDDSSDDEPINNLNSLKPASSPKKQNQKTV
jgi:hypothetical protein